MYENMVKTKAYFAIPTMPVTWMVALLLATSLGQVCYYFFYKSTNIYIRILCSTKIYSQNSDILTIYYEL